MGKETEAKISLFITLRSSIIAAIILFPVSHKSLQLPWMANIITGIPGGNLSTDSNVFILWWKHQNLTFTVVC